MEPVVQAKILLVEDAPELLTIWKTLFRSGARYQVRACQSGASALDAVRDGFHPDVLVTDFYLGDLTGLELIEEVRRISPRTKVIMATGNSDECALSVMEGIPAFRLFQKPVKFSELRTATEQLLNH